jgi:hypothetical protein
MKFTYREVHAFEDAQRNFEQLEPLVSGGTSDTVTAGLVRTNLGLPDGSGNAPFMQYPGAVANREMNWGTSTATWPGASVTTAAVTQAHGLGKTPSVVFFTCFQATFATFAWETAAADGTNIHFVAAAPGSTPTNGTTTTVHWLVIG